MMLFKNKSSNNKRFLYLGVIPAVLVVGLSTLVFNTSRAKSVVTKVESKIEDVKLPTSEVSAHIENPTTVQHTQIEWVNPISQIMANDTIKEGGNEVFVTTEINPEPKGGMDAFRKWIGDNYQYPQAAIDAGAKGTIKTKFVIEKDGSLSDIKVVEDLGHGTGEAAVELLKKSPKWLPAIQNGRKVRYEFELPIRLDLTNMEEVQERLPRAEPALGYNQLRKRINNNFKFPRALNSKDIDPYIYLKFEVAPDGKITPNGGKSDLGIEFITELSKHIKNSEWIPSTVNGKKVKSEGSIYIKFDRSGNIIEDYTRVEIIPEPKGGLNAFHSYLQSNLKYPSGLNKNGVNRIVHRFIVGKDGQPRTVKSKSSYVTFKIVPEVISDANMVINNYGKWLPGVIDGQKVEVSYALVIEFNKGNISTSLKGGVFNKSSLL